MTGVQTCAPPIFINRNGTIIIPNGHDSIEVDDTVMIVTTHTGFNDIQDILD